MHSLDINIAGLEQGMRYNVTTHSGRFYPNVVFITDTGWNNRPVLCFRRAESGNELQLNPSYIESIEEAETVEQEKMEYTFDNFDDVAAQKGQYEKST